MRGFYLSLTKALFAYIIPSIRNDTDRTSQEAKWESVANVAALRNVKFAKARATTVLFSWRRNVAGAAEQANAPNAAEPDETDYLIHFFSD